MKSWKEFIYKVKIASLNRKYSHYADNCRLILIELILIFEILLESFCFCAFQSWQTGKGWEAKDNFPLRSKADRYGLTGSLNS